ncbi:MAG: putative arabinose efflux permease, family [Marmoricola sp.]|nr:putative arabinose efflux permease, family [Marmoricola sp.]
MTVPVITPSAASARTSFRALVRAVDRPFLVLDAAARLPTAMLPLGLLLYVADRTGSYATGGLAVAALSVGGGLGGSLVGLAADRFGQRRVGVLVTLVQVLAVAAFLVLGPADVLPVTLGLAAVIGLANPQAGAMARSRWAAIARVRADRRSFTATAMAWEGTLDEASFVVGPVLVSTVAGVTEPAVGLLLALVLAAVSQVGFALHPSALPGHDRTRSAEHVHRTPLPLLRVGGLLIAMSAVGLVFGATQTGVAARMAAAGTEELTGPVYAAMGVGSAIAGLLTTRLPLAFRLEARIAASGALIAVAGLAGARAHEPGFLALTCLLLGIALAPALVSSYALAERAAPQGWATTTMTMLGTANVAGVAAGAAVAGLLVDRAAPGAALLVDAGAGVLVLAAGLVTLVGACRPGQAVGSG